MLPAFSATADRPRCRRHDGFRRRDAAPRYAFSLSFFAAAAPFLLQLLFFFAFSPPLHYSRRLAFAVAMPLPPAC